MSLASRTTSVLKAAVQKQQLTFPSSFIRHRLKEHWAGDVAGVEVHCRGIAHGIERLGLENDAVGIKHADFAALAGNPSEGVHWARIHGLMLAVAAQKHKAPVLYTLDKAGFSTLKTSVPAQAP